MYHQTFIRWQCYGLGLLGLFTSLAWVLLVYSLTLSSGMAAERIKDLASVGGVRNNQLVGYGLVVGLPGSGDRTNQAPFTVQSLNSMLGRLGVTIPPGVNPQLRNVAAVTIHAELPPFAKPGQTIDVTVSSIGNATSLQGGALLMSPLRGADGEIYAMAQGNLISSGFGEQGLDGSSVMVNVPTAGRIPNGATIEREVPSSFAQGIGVMLNLHKYDFTTAHRMAEAINELLGDGTAQPVDGASVRVRAPRDPGQRVSFLSVLENVRVEPGEPPARVIINSRTGTVVISNNVTVSAAAVTHGSMTVTVTETFRPGFWGYDRPMVVDPELTAGETFIAPAAETEVAIDEARNPMFMFGPGVSLEEIVNAINRVGAAPADLVSILEALREAGALRAELIVI